MRKLHLATAWVNAVSPNIGLSYCSRSIKLDRLTTDRRVATCAQCLEIDKRKNSKDEKDNERDAGEQKESTP